MKIIKIVLVLIFVLFAAVQYNDPGDGLLWMAMYGSIAVVAGFGVVNKYNIPVIFALMAVSLIWALSLAPAVYDWFAHHNTEEIFESMSPDKIFIEEARECFGLLIGFFSLLFLYFDAKKVKKSTKQLA